MKCRLDLVLITSKSEIENEKSSDKARVDQVQISGRVVTCKTRAGWQFLASRLLRLKRKCSRREMEFSWPPSPVKYPTRQPVVRFTTPRTLIQGWSFGNPPPVLRYDRSRSRYS